MADSKNPYSSVIKAAILDCLCRLFDEKGSAGKMTLDEVHQCVNKQVQATVGRVESTLVSLYQGGKGVRRINRDVGSSGDWLYSATIETYNKSLENGELIGPPPEKTDTSGSVDAWEPLEVENHDTVADTLDELANNLAGENGYTAEHTLEAEYTIDATHSVAQSLRNNEGKTLKIRLQNLLHLLERTLSILDKGTRIGKILSPIVEFLRNLLS